MRLLPLCLCAHALSLRMPSVRRSRVLLRASPQPHMRSTQGSSAQGSSAQGSSAQGASVSVLGRGSAAEAMELLLQRELSEENHFEVVRLMKKFLADVPSIGLTQTASLRSPGNASSSSSSSQRQRSPPSKSLESKAIEKCFSHAIASCMYFVSVNNALAWYALRDMVILAHGKHILISQRTVGALIKIGVQQRQNYGLAQLQSVLFNRALPVAFSLENYLRVLCTSQPRAALYAFSKYIQTNSSSATSGIPSGPCYVYVFKAISTLLQQPNTSIASIQTSLLNGTLLASNTLVNLFDLAVANKYITVGCIVTCVITLRDARDFTGLYTIFAKSKVLAREGKVLDIRDGVLPAIVFGQTVVSFAKLGADSLTYQTICDMLEAGCRPTEETLNNVFLELSRIGSHKVVIAILEQLQRYRIPVSTISLNSMLNSCEKAGDYAAALAIGEQKMSPQQIDQVGMSVLVKSCDKMNMPLKAVRIILQSMHANVYVSMSLRERVFAILVKNRVPHLAIDLLMYLEQYFSNKGHVDEAILTSLAEGEYTNDGFTSDDDNDYAVVNEISSALSFQLLLSIDTPVTQSPAIYGAVIACLSASKRAQEAYEVLNCYISRGGVETPDMYVSVISAFKFVRNVGAADIVFAQLGHRVKRMQAISPSRTTGGWLTQPTQPVAPLSITIAHFNALLSVYSAAKVLDERKDEILASITEHGLAWDTHTYTSLIIGSTPDEILHLFASIMDANIVPTNASIRFTLRAAATKMNGEFALRLIRYIWSHSMNIDAYDYILTFSTLRKAQLTDEAIVLLNDMIERDVMVPPLCFLTALIGIAKKSDWKKSINLLLLMIRMGIPVEPRAFNLVLSSCNKASEYKLAISLYDQIQVLTKGKYLPNHSTFSLAVYAAWKLRDGDKALNILNAMVDRRVPPSTATVTQVIACLEACKQYEDCTAVFNRFIGKPSPRDELISSSATSTEVDLHGYSIHVAKAAVLSVLYSIRHDQLTGHKSKKDVIIITGIGKNSREWLEPILKPAVLKWLEEGFTPSLKVTEIATNPGRLLLPCSVIDDWLAGGGLLAEDSASMQEFL